MNADTEIDLDDLQDAIADQIAAAFPEFQTVEFYREERDRDRLPVPACLLELTGLEPTADADPGTGQLAASARFEARIVIGFRTPNAKRAVRKLAAALAAFLHHRRWGRPVGPAQVIEATPDDFTPELDNCEVWRVEWEQVVHLGESVWIGSDAITPTDVRVSWVPRVGIPHEPDYERVTP